MSSNLFTDDLSSTPNLNRIVTYTKDSVLSFSPAPAGSRIRMHWTDHDGSNPSIDYGTLLGWGVVVVASELTERPVYDGEADRWEITTEIQPFFLMPSVWDSPLTLDGYRDETRGAGNFRIEYILGGEPSG
jgi:hypothetical protein